ncbi:hypothetical protein [Roseimaritima ulvae]|uniref:hypothetical protein n=1 Tax=Roseimaritima ulvae TaxID=980254 RepID=UPI001EE4C71D|nr:hypothetical protein [Roseimaritima ulvae]
MIGIDLNHRRLYVCEVAIHLSTGLQYVKNKRPNNINKLTSKFSRDIEYANAYFADYEKHFMLWSPVVKNARPGSLYNQSEHLKEIASNIRGTHGVEIEFVVNQKFQDCMTEMRHFAASQSAELKCPIMRLMQIEEQLGKHIVRLNR